MSAGNIMSSLKRSPAWLQPRAAPGLVSLFTSHGKMIDFKKNSLIAFEGDMLKHVYYLSSGLCRHTFALVGDTPSTISLILPGRCIGDIFTIMQQEVFFKLEVLQDSTLKFIDKELLLNQIRSDGSFALEIMAYFAHKQHSHLEGMICNSVLSAEERLQVLFTNLAKDSTARHDTDFITIPFRLNQDLFAEIVSVSRVTVNKVIGRWMEQGLVYKKDGLFHISKKFLDYLPS